MSDITKTKRPPRLLGALDPNQVEARTPDWLCRLRWVVVNRLKEPLSATTFLTADAFDLENQMSFDQALELWRANLARIAGIGYILANGTMTIDVDPLREIEARRLHLPGKTVAETIEIGRQLRLALAAEFKGFYCETSGSLQGGFHIVVRCPPLGHPAIALLRKLAIDIYFDNSNRQVVATGMALNDAHEVLDGASTLLELFDNIQEDYGNKDDLPVGEVELGPYESVDYGPDDEAIVAATAELCQDKEKPFRARLNTPAEPGDWSDVMFGLLGDLVWARCPPDRAYAILERSPFVTQSPPSAKGEERPRKLKRRFDPEWAEQIKQQAKRKAAQIEYAKGRSFYDPTAVEAIKARSDTGYVVGSNCHIYPTVAELLAAFDPTPLPPPPDEPAIDGLTDNASTLVNYLAGAELDRKWLSLSRPSGVFGEFVELCEKGMFNPYTRFALPATAAVMAGLLARWLKTPSGRGCILFLLVIAKSGAGKNQGIDAWKRFIHNALEDDKPLATQVKTAIGNLQPAILQKPGGTKEGLHNKLQQHGSFVWVLTECASVLRTIMSDSVRHNDGTMRDLVNNAFDICRHGFFHDPTGSIAAANRGDESINNMNVSLYWATTPTRARGVYTKDTLTDGFGNRSQAIVEEGAAGSYDREHRELEHLPEAPRKLVLDLVRRWLWINNLYATGQDAFAEKMIVRATWSPEAYRIIQAVIERQETFKTAQHKELTGYPDYYIAFVRVAMLAPALATIAAGLRWCREHPFPDDEELPNTPQEWKGYGCPGPEISADDISQALGYVLQNIGNLVAMVDRGEFAADYTDGVTTGVRIYKRLIRQEPHKSNRYVDHNSFAQELGRQQALRDMTEMNRNVRGAVASVINDMIDGGMLQAEQMKSEGRKRAPKVYYRTDHDCWTRNV